MRSSINKLALITLFSFLIASTAYGEERNSIPLQSIYYNNLMLMSLSNCYLPALFYLNSPIWFAISLQSSEYNYFQDTDTTWKPTILPVYQPYRYSSRHPLELRNQKEKSEYFQRILNIDSAGKEYYYSEIFDKYEVNYPYKIDLEQYLAIKKRKVENQIWDSLVTRYDIMSALSGYDLARMLSQGTGITIPVPPNFVMGLFGKPEISINVSGEVNLRMGWRWDSQNLGTVSAFGQSQSSPIFSQDIRVNVSGKIGDKLELKTDWNTRRQFEYDNKFKVGYEGEDDEIIKLIEVGNVTLPLPTSLISGGQALFGVRADFQFGPLFLKTIASQKRGERRLVNVQGGVSKQWFQLRAYDFARNHFFLDTAYKKVYREYFKSSTPVIPQSSLKTMVKEIEVWESTGGEFNSVGGLYSNAIAFADLEPKKYNNKEFYDIKTMKNAVPKTGVIERGNFYQLDSSRFSYDRNLGTLTIHNLRQDRNYAVAYRIEGETTQPEDDEYYGTTTLAFGQQKQDSTVRILKLVYCNNLQPGFKTLWSRLMKNVYSINASQVNTEDTRIGIWYINQTNDSSDVLQGASDKLVTIFRVDQITNGTGNVPPDGEFDLRTPFFDAYRGEITFPSLEPFREGLITYFEAQGTPELANQYTFGEIYDTTYEAARKNTTRDRFIISGEVSGRTSNRISLGAFQLSPGSVKVTLDGVVLREYEDYVIDYLTGMLTIRNQRATLPNANLKIEYESQDIFNISTKSLLGLRGDYQLFKSRTLNANLGFTVMYYDQSAIIDRVRLGEEPVSNTMLGIDAKMQWDVPWLTKMLDYLPFYDTKVPSSFSASAELAMVLPEPNKRLSEVSSDNNEPVVYIDDFEGSQRYISLGLSPSQWTHCSQPQDNAIGVDDVERAKFRGKTYWYQYGLPRVPINWVYPKRQVIQGHSNLSPLYFVFDYKTRGIYNHNADFLDPINPKFDTTNIFSQKKENRERIWGGMMRLLSSFNTNFDNENIEYIEIMMHIEEYIPNNTKMFIELGQITEDVIPNNTLNTEDGITNANPYPNGIIDAGEDVGIDQINNTKEKEESEYPYPLNLESDPARDDYAFDFGKDDDLRNAEDFVKYNNYEGNAGVSELGQFPDTEILNKNNGIELSKANDYFTYEVQLNPDPNTNSQIVGGNDDSKWFLYRIPIRRPTSVTGTPLFTNIQYVRIWAKGGPLKLQIADWKLVGSYWQKNSSVQSGVPANDSCLDVAFVNVEENSEAPDYYTMPPGVQAPRQLNNPDPSQDIRLNEQSLSISSRNLRYGEERMAVRFFRPLDIFYYEKLKFFIHGDGSMPDEVVKGAVPKAYAYLRFGTDSLNYYEYRRPLLRNWQNIEIVLSDLTAIKQVRDSLGQFKRMEFSAPNDELAIYAIRGNPILTKVQFFGFGISNPSARYPNELTTTMWVDELRLLSPEDRADWAGVADVNLKLADLGQVTANISHSNPNFHKLEERFGDRTTETNWNVTMQGNLEKFAPKSFKEMKIPITYTHSENTQNPEYEANNDINLEAAANAAYTRAKKEMKSDAEAQQIADAVRTRSQTVTVMDSWAITSMRLGLPVDSWLVRETVNKITFGYSYSQQFERSPVVQEKFTWMWRLTTQYGTTIPDIASVKPLTWLEEVPLLETYKDLKLSFLPATLSAALNMQRRRVTEQSRLLSYPSPVIRDFSAERQAQFSWKLAEGGFINPIFDYTMNTSSSLVGFELDENGKQRTGGEVARQILFNNGALIDLGDDISHTQTVNINIKPKLPIGTAARFLDLTGTFNTVYNWTNPLQPDPAIHNIAKSASYNNSIRFNIAFKLKSLADNLFPTSQAKGTPMSPPVDSLSTGSNIMSGIGSVLKVIFLDFEKVDFTFNQSNNSVNPGVFGGTGINNFWARGMIGRPSELMFGPSMAYQLGLVTNPHGGWNIVPSNSFPFFDFETYTGLRPPNAILQDNFSQRTSLEARTSRPLWKGAVLELNWKTELGFNKTMTVITDSLGVPTFTNVLATESLSRNYLTFPSIFGMNLFDNTIEHVIELYQVERAKIMAMGLDTIKQNQKLLQALSDAFHDGLEAFSFTKGKIGRFLPSVNWAIRWEGIEKWDIWDGYPKKISVEHIYSSRYTENSQTTDNGKQINGQQVQYGFQPMIGITASFDEKKVGGVLTATIRYNTTTGFSMTSSNSSTIARNSSDELQFQASYSLRGFDFPLFGIMLKNDLEFSLLTSYKKTQRATYDISALNNNYGGEDGRTLDGNSQFTIEPRVSYTMSDRIRASFFVRYDGTSTEGASNPGYSTTQVGLDIRLSIAGGK